MYFFNNLNIIHTRCTWFLAIDLLYLTQKYTIFAFQKLKKRYTNVAFILIFAMLASFLNFFLAQKRVLLYKSASWLVIKNMISKWESTSKQNLHSIKKKNEQGMYYNLPLGVFEKLNCDCSIFDPDHWWKKKQSLKLLFPVSVLRNQILVSNPYLAGSTVLAELNDPFLYTVAAFSSATIN